MSKRLLGLTLGVSTLVVAGWYLLSQEKEEQTQDLETVSPVELDGNKISQRPEAPKLNWVKKAAPSKNTVVTAKRATHRPKKSKAQKFDLIAKRLKKDSVDENHRKLLAPKKMITKMMHNKARPGDTPWIASLSGPDAAVAMQISPEDEQSCLGSACEYMRDPAINVAGVVLESERFGLKDESVLKGQLAQGDGKRTPFVYVE